MRHLTSVAVRPVAAAVLAASLICGLTAGAAQAAAGPAAGRLSGAAQATKVSWHTLALRNGWKSARSKSYDVANPSYAVRGGIVYLDGSLHQATGVKTEFAVLPRGARPARKLFLTVLSGSAAGVPGTVEIRPDGVMTASSPAGSARLLTSLEAVSFPAAGVHWTGLKLLNGWKSGATAFGTGGPAFTVTAGIVHLSGSLFSSGADATFATLAKRARPRRTLYISAYDSGGTAGDLVIYPDGTIDSFGGAAFTQTALDGVSFPAAAAKFTWHKLKLSTGWSSSQSAYQTGDPQYAVSGPIVYLAGSMHFNIASGGDAIFADIPKAARSVHEIIRQVYTFGGSTGGITLTPTFGIASSNPAADAQDYTSLAGIAYPRNS